MKWPPAIGRWAWSLRGYYHKQTDGDRECARGELRRYYRDARGAACELVVDRALAEAAGLQPSLAVPRRLRFGRLRRPRTARRKRAIGRELRDAVFRLCSAAGLLLGLL
jgi:hypothetical protein